jgi:Ca2+-binding EF-hand superfamily protein
VHDAFATVDVNKNGFITREELKGLLKEYEFFPTD